MYVDCIGRIAFGELCHCTHIGLGIEIGRSFGEYFLDWWCAWDSRCGAELGRVWVRCGGDRISPLLPRASVCHSASAAAVPA